ncbi:MAG: hypothetical protein Faunusvirus65_1, partial [Faunusvirus sp.]
GFLKEFVISGKSKQVLINSVKEQYCKNNKIELGQCDINISDIPYKLNVMVAFQFSKLMRDIWSGSGGSITPTIFKFMIGQKYDMFKETKQQDSQEALLYILDTMSDETMVKSDKPTIPPPFRADAPELLEFIKMYDEIMKSIPTANAEGMTKEQIVEKKKEITRDIGIMEKELKAYNYSDYMQFIANQFYRGYIRNGRSHIGEMMHVFLRSTLTCPDCKNSSHSFNQDYFLSISIPSQTVDAEKKTDHVPITEHQIAKDGTILRDARKWRENYMRRDKKNTMRQMNTRPKFSSAKGVGYDSDSDHSMSDTSDDEGPNPRNRFMREFDLKRKKEDDKESMIIKRLNLDNSEYTLEDCLKKFADIETLGDTDKWLCGVCKYKVKAEKKLEIWLPPSVLIVHIKRFVRTEIGSLKKKNKINFPLTGLCLDGYIAPASKVGRSYVYDLFAINNHHTSGYDIGGGHYFSYCMNFATGDWFEYNDKNVYKVAKDKLVSSDAYMLFYKLKA